MTHRSPTAEKGVRPLSQPHDIWIIQEKEDD
jgi:hypothetical protein